jgi:hypothetical protein
MRYTLLALATLAVLAAAVPAHAQFNKRYCSFGGSDNSGGGLPDCSFNTWEQCRMSASGLARYCGENPFWKPEGASGNDRPQRGKKTRE